MKKKKIRKIVNELIVEDNLIPQESSIKEKILSILEGGKILLIIPPFRHIFDVALGPQILQVLAKEKGYKTDILYLDMLLASVIGVQTFEKIYYEPIFRMMGERLFARSAFGLPPLGKNPGYCMDERMSIRGSKNHPKIYYLEAYQDFDPDFFLKIEDICNTFIEEVAAVIASLDYKIVGCSTLNGQTNCSIALLRGIKKHCPRTITIIGGNNCNGDMAEGIASLCPDNSIDYIFSGESETTFLEFLRCFSAQELPPGRIITGEPLMDLDSLPLPDYEIFLNQFNHFLGKKYLKKMRVWYETSRGCFWGQKHKCTFCGINPIVHRKKTINKVVNDLKKIGKSYPIELLLMADNIMPPSYGEELLPVICREKGLPALGYQIRPTVNLHDIIHFKKANIIALLVGIEEFVPALLKLMKKGITARQNILLLRNAKSVGISCDWNLLWGFPGDKVSDYKMLFRILPLIRHLQPPKEFHPMVIFRFSPYFNNPQKYKITHLRPWAVFNMIYPDGADVDKLAAYHIGEYPCESCANEGIMKKIANEVAKWRKMWKDTSLVMKNFNGTYIIYDNRDINQKQKTHVLEYQKAKEIMTASVYKESEAQKWAVKKKLGIILDSWYLPLVTASPELLLQFEKKYDTTKIIT